MAIGSGLRVEVWKEFLRRFGYLHIYEFYGATEANIVFINYTEKVGAIGKSNFLFKKIIKFELIKYDVDQDKVVRDKNGHCIPVATGHEGKIGMAAVQLKDGLSFDGKGLYVHVKDYMPSYAIPRFIRLRESLEITETFKQRKGQLVKEGFDPACISDPLYFLDDSEKCYVPMTQEIFRSIAEKKLKL
ncbi:hypothetical protein JD844_001754 [Phrynosoma platyrhinos]|uniref:Uncharacterized protein n=1 Tax=Phrynosoma platyrhinos TaxID=52577 RepID=A0ABQ7TB58_PHRPL|nr:hypothetical protein JD844_001754 [Phrynosoma platyrhinos]